ncbi:type IV secretory system conjugative DNA transfer family protein [Nakamurella panacisegetis]|uniref:type IV secretory system conjugative DNA transfer family protein n=1 Tax=Nakamurella panacisegetis TaxID=1090615 RepID=UPI0012FE5378
MSAYDQARRLLQDARSIYLGRENSVPLFASSADHSLVLGPPRCGKTSGLLIPSVAVHPGPVVVTSTRADIVSATLAARQEIASRAGSMVATLIFDEPQESRSPRRSWSVTDGCADWGTALDRANVLAATAIHDEKNGFFRDAARDLLAGCLFAAALASESDRVMVGRIRRGEVQYYQDLIEYHTHDYHPARLVLSGIVDPNQMAAETRQSVYATVSAQYWGSFCTPRTKQLNG